MFCIHNITSGVLKERDKFVNAFVEKKILRLMSKE